MLQYWTVLSLLYMFDQTLEVAASWIPFYYSAKLLLLSLLLAPKSGAVSWIFTSLVQPLIRTAHARLAERALPAAGSRVMQLVRSVQSWFVGSFFNSLPNEERQAWVNTLQSQGALLEAREREAAASAAGGTAAPPLGPSGKN